MSRSIDGIEIDSRFFGDIEQTVRPVGDVSDSLSEQYAFVIPLPRAGSAAQAAPPPQSKRSRRGRVAQPPVPEGVLSTSKRWLSRSSWRHRS